jgi:hypothetical protein
MCSAHKASMTIHELLECYNVAKEEQDEEDLRNIQLTETKGEHTVEGSKLEFVCICTTTKDTKDKYSNKRKSKFCADRRLLE